MEKIEKNEKNINPKNLWIAYGICLVLSICIGILPIEEQTILDLAAIINLPTIIIVIVATLCSPIRLIQAAAKKDRAYLHAGVLCGLIPLVHILLATVIFAGNQ